MVFRKAESDWSIDESQSFVDDENFARRKARQNARAVV